jgi:LETM1 and EF-hand domain-containing protein 1
MLPSTFESKFQEEEKRRKILKVRLEMASFLQDTVQVIFINFFYIKEASANSNVNDPSAAKQFKEFFEKCQSSGEQLPLEEILKISKNFPDELTLGNLSRPQLVSMTKYMSLNAFGTDVCFIELY